MIEKLQVSRYPMCSNENRTYNNEQKYDGEITIQDENIVFKAKALYWINENNLDLIIPLRDIEKVEPINLNLVMPVGVCIFMKNGSQHVLGYENNKKLCKFILDAKNKIEGNEPQIQKPKKEPKKKKPRKKINIKVLIVSLISIIIIIGIFVIYIMVYNNEQKKILIQEVDKIKSLNSYTEQVDMNIKTKGDYAIVEQVIKEYNSKLMSLERQYYNNSAMPIFNEMTPKYLEENKENLEQKLNSLSQNEKIANESIQNIIKMLNTNYIKQEISKYNLDSKYISMYNDLMLNNNNTKLIQEWKLTLKTNTEKMSYVRELMQILVRDINDWNVKNGLISFKNPDSLERYNIVYDKLYK